MWDKAKEFVKNNRWAQFALVLLLGVAIGAIFYPTKHIEDRVTKKFEEQITKINEEHLKTVSALKETLDKQEQQYRATISQKDSKLSSLTVEIRDLKVSKKTTYYKIVHPDGTIEVKKSSDTETDESSKVTSRIQEEFKEKVESIEQKWETIHKERVENLRTEYSKKEQDYQKRIDELEEEHIIDINPKKFGVEVGATLNKSPYLHINADVFGPFFVGAHASTGPVNTLGAGLGIRF